MRRYERHARPIRRRRGLRRRHRRQDDGRRRRSRHFARRIARHAPQHSCCTLRHCRRRRTVIASRASVRRGDASVLPSRHTEAAVGARVCAVGAVGATVQATRATTRAMRATGQTDAASARWSCDRRAFAPRSDRNRDHTPLHIPRARNRARSQPPLQKSSTRGLGLGATTPDHDAQRGADNIGAPSLISPSSPRRSTATRTQSPHCSTRSPPAASRPPYR